ARTDRIVANGQCLLVPRERFRAAGGWAPVRANMTEDVALARHLVRAGWRVGMADAAPLLVVDMHASGREAWREWGRSLALPGVASRGEQLVDVVTLLLVLALPPWMLLAALLTGSWWVATPSLVLLAVRLLLHGALRATYDRPPAADWLAPLGFRGGRSLLCLAGGAIVVMPLACIVGGVVLLAVRWRFGFARGIQACLIVAPFAAWFFYGAGLRLAIAVGLLLFVGVRSYLADRALARAGIQKHQDERA
ncbi:MAG: glycosyltransferase, partial [Actinomycetota bacterium]